MQTYDSPTECSGVETGVTAFAGFLAMLTRSFRVGLVVSGLGVSGIAMGGIGVTIGSSGSGSKGIGSGIGRVGKGTGVGAGAGAGSGFTRFD